MELNIGETIKYNGVSLIVIEGKNNSCEGCFFSGRTLCSAAISEIYCSASYRDDNKSVIFKEVKDMETRTIKLTLEKAKEFYKKGGEFRDLALSAYTEEELTKVELSKTWEEFCDNYNVQKEECFIASNSVIVNVSSSDTRLICSDRNLLPNKQAAEAHLALMQLHQLRDCYRQGWKPDWSDGEDKYCIVRSYNDTNHLVAAYKGAKVFLSFQSADIARLFLKNFRGLIEAAGDLV